MGQENDRGGGESLYDLIKDVKKLNQEPSSEDRTPPTLEGELRDLAIILNKMVLNIESSDELMKPTVKDIPEARNELLDIHRMSEEGVHLVLSHVEELLENHETMNKLIEEIEAIGMGTGPPGEEFPNVLGKQRSLLGLNQKILTNLMSAVEFQDLAGQKIGRIRSMLQNIQGRILRMIVLMGAPMNEESDRTGRANDYLREIDQASKENKKLDQALVDDILEKFGL